MLDTRKNQQRILEKLGIEKLNPMQEETHKAIQSASEVVLLSPTGTGKTLAFLLPIIEMLNAENPEVQVLILAPSRELAMQIEQVAREMGSGFKTNAVYGGRPFNQDKIDLKHRPAILVGTPGRIADHLRRGTFSTKSIKTLVLDEFDKSLEIGFEEEMSEITWALEAVEKKILTSATQRAKIPKFVGIKNPKKINYLKEGESQLQLKTVVAPNKDKLETLVDLLCHIGAEPGIIFCNLKDSIDEISDYLYDKRISHGCFYGGMEQMDRERALVKFRNGTHQLLLATDLAARGIDIPEMKFIIHFHLPLKEHEFIHRNGRTARMNSDGTAYILKYENEVLPEYVKDVEVEELSKSPLPAPSLWETLYISGGRRDKISKGDIAGLFFKQGKLKSDELGVIEIQPDHAFVSVPKTKVDSVINLVNNTKLKTKKVRISVL
ncbi:DEAD/DEAH box helicase [Owenweeksia hongkongensis]|uniref:DEAD/DEAH box helicase n=1 Tax=Owenweeksia hongkongensis TaxID=253245 RepID=UPI003A94F537